MTEDGISKGVVPAAIVAADAEQHLSGIFTGRDAVRVLATAEDPGATRVRDAMTRSPVTLDNKMPKLTERAKAALISNGPVLAGCLSYRQPYISALTAGKAGFEEQKELKAEINQIWEDVKKLAARPLPICTAKERAAND